MCGWLCLRGDIFWNDAFSVNKLDVSKISSSVLISSLSRIYIYILRGNN